MQTSITAQFASHGRSYRITSVESCSLASMMRPRRCRTSWRDTVRQFARTAGGPAPVFMRTKIGTSPSKQLSDKQVNAIVVRCLRKYDKLNFLESFAMFVGKAQLVELGLKRLLMSKYGLEQENIEKWTLGRVIRELKDRGCRRDFVALLEELNRYRNYIAHDILADDAIMRKLTDSRAQRFA